MPHRSSEGNGHPVALGQQSLLDILGPLVDLLLQRPRTMLRICYRVSGASKGQRVLFDRLRYPLFFNSTRRFAGDLLERNFAFASLDREGLHRPGHRCHFARPR